MLPVLSSKSRFLVTAGAVTLFVLVVFGPLTAPLWAQAPTAQSPALPQWQMDAGGKMVFDVASVKQNKSGPPPSGHPVTSNVPLDPQDTYFTKGGLFSATNESLITYLAFAYKLDAIQLQDLMPGLPAWAKTDRFDIEARAQG